MRIETENYRMMLETRVDLVCLRDAELVLVFKALSVLFIRKAYFLGLRIQPGRRCDTMSSSRLFFLLPNTRNINVCWDEVRLFTSLHYITSISFLEIERLAGTCTSISSARFLSTYASSLGAHIFLLHSPSLS